MQGDLDQNEALDVTDSSLEPPPRSPEELKQLVGAMAISEMVIGEVQARESSPMLEVHEETRNQLTWKPRFYAQNSSGTLRVKVTRLESEALLAAGASSKH